jgi:two-component system phosphate regulon sensor histidine kinase PhoR
MLQLDFVSKVSHELRTPLTSVRMFAETLQLNRTRDPEQLELCLDVLDKETARLSDRIERLLSWGSMESGQRVWAAEPVGLDEVVAEALALLVPAVIDSVDRVELEIPEPPPVVRGDRLALADAVLNLLSNAVKYGGSYRPIRVEVGSAGRYARLSVTDQGIGIPRRLQKRIFERFYRVDERLSRHVEGSGLGLAIVRLVVRAHGGRVEVTSEPGQGSTFTMVLPLAS